MPRRPGPALLLLLAASLFAPTPAEAQQLPVSVHFRTLHGTTGATLETGFSDYRASEITGILHFVESLALYATWSRSISTCDRPACARIEYRLASVSGGGQLSYRVGSVRGIARLGFVTGTPEVIGFFKDRRPVYSRLQHTASSEWETGLDWLAPWGISVGARLGQRRARLSADGEDLSNWRKVSDAGETDAGDWRVTTFGLEVSWHPGRAVIVRAGEAGR